MDRFIGNGRKQACPITGELETIGWSSLQVHYERAFSETAGFSTAKACQSSEVISTKGTSEPGKTEN